MRISKLVMAGAAIAAALVATLPASPAQATPVASGTVTVVVPADVVNYYSRKGVTVTLTTPGTTSRAADCTTTYATPATGGDLNLSEFLGYATLGGKLTFYRNFKSVQFEALVLDVNNFQVFGTSKSDGTVVPLFTLTAASVFSATELQVDGLQLDPAGAAYLNSKLKTNVFVASSAVGTLNATFTLA